MTIVERAAAIDDARIYAVQGEKADAYALRLVVNFPNGPPRDFDSQVRRGKIRGRLHNEGSKETYDLFRTAGARLAKKAA